MSSKKRASFTGKLGFVLSAAGASVGLGNIWRFPYLCAKYGGGTYLICYIILAATFGYTMIMAETAIGRMSQKSPVGAFNHFTKKKGYRLGGWINAIVPMLIVPYYSVIGGWVIKYMVDYITKPAKDIAVDGYFSSFISGVSPEVWFIVFALLTTVIVYMGVQGGIERVSKILMPILVVLAFIICIYTMTRPGAG
ncbi:MAG: sodium-dependent transporter, partial [Lachnospiraceae bacterium]|nr:sodium-dependent transporter [Lachnospiraceae bacterium]